MTEPSYDDAVDMWGVGLILAELLKRSDKYNNRSFKEKFLFRGKSCYPMSPADLNNQNNIEKSDQIFKIASKMPNLLTETDLTFLSNED